MEKRKTNPHLSRKRNFQFDGVINMKSLMALKRNKPFTKAVSNMAVMDITDINAPPSKRQLCSIRRVDG